MGKHDTSKLNVRMPDDILSQFKRKSESMGKPYQVLVREICVAFVDGRLRIIPTQDQSDNLGELYVNRKNT